MSMAEDGETLMTLTQQFMDYFNQIEQHMRTVLVAPPGQPFRSLITPYYQKCPWVVGESDLNSFASLRNAVVHTTLDSACPLFSASEEAVRKIKIIAAHMLRPELVLARFGRTVETVTPDATVFSVLMLIRERDYTQFPVYEKTNFHGLLTENGITRWLARNVAEQSISLSDVYVRDLLTLEEGKRRHEFLPSDAPTDRVAYLYATNPDLEAVLITPDGTVSHNLKGIATRYDVIQLRAAEGRISNPAT